MALAQFDRPVPSVGPGILTEFPIPFSAFTAPNRHAGGRPTKLTDEVLVELECLIALTPIGKKHLSTLLGVVHQTLRNWEDQGKDDRERGIETRATRFLDLFEKGQAYWRIRLMHAQLTGDKTWAKYATALERLWPDEFGRRMEDNGGPKVFVQIGAEASDVKILVQGGPVQGDLSDG